MSKKRRSETVAICNQKGGVGKSSSTSALGAGLYRKGYRVLYLDLDGQCTLSYNMGIDGSPVSSLDILEGTVPAEEAIVETPQGDLIPATPELAGAEEIFSGSGREYKLKEALDPVLKDYDYILLDCPPALGSMTVNALTASDSVLIPAHAETSSLQGIGQLSNTIQAVREYSNPDLKIKGILITRWKPRTRLARDIAQLLEETASLMDTRLFNAKIRESTVMAEAEARREDIFSYSPRSNPALDYGELVEEFLKIR